MNPRESVANGLDVEVLHIQRVLFDELAPRFDVFAHERGEDGLALGNVFKSHGEQRPPLGIHCRLPKLRRSHLTQTFVALDGEVLAAFIDDVIAKIADIRLLDDLDFFLFGDRLGCLLFGLAVIVGRGLGIAVARRRGFD